MPRDQAGSTIPVIKRLWLRGGMLIVSWMTFSFWIVERVKVML